MITNPVLDSDSLVYQIYLARKGRSVYAAEFLGSCSPSRSRMLTPEEIRSVFLRGCERAKDLVDSI